MHIPPTTFYLESSKAIAKQLTVAVTTDLELDLPPR